MMPRARERLARVGKHATGWFVTIDGEVVEDIGKHGVVQNKSVAEPIYRTIKALHKDKDVQLVGVYRVKS